MWRVLLALCVFSAPVLADWTLDPAQSGVHFMSTKNNHITEVHTFDSLNGSLKDGRANVSIPLSSVNTIIDIRNQRMQSMLFDIANYPLASFTADIDDSLMNLPKGQSKNTDVTGTLSLHGKEVKTTFSVKVTRTDSGEMVVATTKPYILNVADFDLISGVEALRNIAGLQVIGYAVPITFNVVFNAS